MLGEKLADQHSNAKGFGDAMVMFHAVEIRNGGSWLQMYLGLWELIGIFHALVCVPSARE